MLWHSVAPWASSAYGVQTRLVTTELGRIGLDITLSVGAGLRGGPLEWDGRTVLPAPSGVAGSLSTWVEALDETAEGPDLVVTLLDCWRLRDERLADRRVLSWVPVDGTPIPPYMVRHFRATGTRALAMTRNATDEFTQHGVEAAYVPCAIDPAIYRPDDPIDRRNSRRRARERAGLPGDSYIVGIVATNGDRRHNRKCLPESIEAVGRFAASNPDTLLYLHTDVGGTLHDGPDLRPLLETWRSRGLRWVATPVIDLMRGLPPTAMATMYNAFDVLLSTSGAEGFGLPLVEAQACGTPVIASDFGAQRDHVASGRLVDGQRRWVPELGAWFFTPEIEDVVDALAEMSSRRDTSIDPGMERFHIDRVFSDHWLPLVDEAARD